MKYILILSLLLSNTLFANDAPKAPEIKPETLYQETDKASKEQDKFTKVASNVSKAMGVAAAICWAAKKPDKHTCIAYTLASVGAAVVGMHNSSNSSKNSNLANQFKSGSDYEEASTGNSNGGSGQSTGAIDTKTFQEIERVGKVKINPKAGTVTTEDGKVYSQQDISSAAAMSAAGLNPSVLSNIKAEIKKITDNVEKKSADGAMEGDVVVGTQKDGSGSGNIPNFDGVARGAGINSSRDPATEVAGLTKNYNGELIGVSADSLFSIIDRRYKLHNEKGSFLSGK